MHKRPFFTLLKWLFSSAMLYYAVHEIDVAQLKSMFLRQHPLIPITVIALMILQMFTSTFRWQRVLFVLSGRSLKQPFEKLFNLNFISVFFNSCLPGTIGGDVVRAMLLKSHECPLTLCAHSVIVDRLMAMVGLCAAVIFLLPVLGHIIPTLPVTLLISLSIVGFIIGLAFLSNAPRFIARLPSTHMMRMLTALIESMQKIVFSPRDFTILITQALLAHACFCLGVYILSVSMGLNLNFIDSLVLIPPVLLLMMLPISVGGWGVREVSMVGMLGLVGIPKEAALAISVQMGILLIIASLPGAWLYVKRRKT